MRRLLYDDPYDVAIAALQAIEQMEREKPTDWANWCAGEGTIAAGMAGRLFGEKIIRAIQRGEGSDR